jgi:lysophospholipase L1-like esterase
MNNFTILCLGDSYTIGEMVQLQKTYPYFTVQLLREKGLNFSAPEILAKTGWTSDELELTMKLYRFLPKYDIVTLLIGVNDQYRGKEIIEYKTQFEELLKHAIKLANNKSDHVMVISIPDYSLTPFSASLDRNKISKEIEVFNSVNKAISIQYKVAYIDLTEHSNKTQFDTELIADDQLHYSPKMYKKWAEKLADAITAQVK